jgi:protein gp37
MSGKSAIEWTDATWNPIAGCSVISPGCANCYAMNMAARLHAMGVEHYRGLSKRVNGNSVWTGKIAVAPDEKFLAPLRWKKPRRVFVDSMSDLFHENVADATIDRVFAVMALAPQHTYQVLTKRPARMLAYIEAKRKNAPEWVEFSSLGARVLLPYEGGVPTYVWLGVTAEDQTRADERIPELLATPAAVRFVSIEPILGPIDLYNGDPDPRLGGHKASKTFLGDWWESGDNLKGPSRHGLDWVICGGESGPSARPMRADWARSLRDQCRAAGVPFFFKQWGEFLAGAEIKDKDGLHIAFGDGDRFEVLSDGDDILLASAHEHVGAREKIWRNYWASGDGTLLRRASKALRRLDGVEHNDFPEIC